MNASNRSVAAVNDEASAVKLTDGHHVMKRIICFIFHSLQARGRYNSLSLNNEDKITDNLRCIVFIIP